MAQTQAKENPFSLTNVMSAMIIFMLTLVLNNQWDMKEWKGKKDEIDQEQSAKMTFLRADFGVMSTRQSQVENDVTRLEALIPEQKKRIKGGP